MIRLVAGLFVAIGHERAVGVESGPAFLGGEIGNTDVSRIEPVHEHRVDLDPTEDRALAIAASVVVPVPQNGSRTVSPCTEYMLISR